MLPQAELAAHAWALLAVWTWAWAGGLPFLPCLPRSFRGGDRWAAVPLLGVAYWAVALFVFPFAAGLVYAIAANLVATAILFGRGFYQSKISPRSDSLPAYKKIQGSRRVLAGWTALLLFVGGAVYSTPLWTQHVPPGMDASMHATNARLIAQRGGLPGDHGPFAPEIPFAAVNQGLLSVAALACLLGATPVAATLAVAQWTYAATILALYLLARWRCAPLASAVLAVSGCWLARGVQDTVNWGGFPTVAGVAVGILAARLVVDGLRWGRTRAALAGALSVGALPLLHGIAAASWLYVVAPPAGLLGLLGARQRYRALGHAVLLAYLVGMVVVQYLVIGRPNLKSDVVERIRQWQLEFAPPVDGWNGIANLPRYLVKESDGILASLLIVSTLTLLWYRRWRPAFLVAWVVLTIGLLVANARFWVLPASALLNPERVVYWILPLTVWTSAWAWRVMARQIPGRAWQLVLAIGLLTLGAARHHHYFQRKACRPILSADEWRMLQWSEQHLNPRQDFVEAAYPSAGSYLPAVAGVAVSGWHVHFVQLADLRALGNQRPATYRWARAADAPAAPASSPRFGDWVLERLPPKTYAALPHLGELPANSATP